MNLKNKFNQIFSKKPMNNNTEIFLIEQHELPDADLNFRRDFNKVIDLCEFDQETTHGILFLMGAILPTKVGSDFLKKDRKAALSIFTLYSKSSGDFADYGELSDIPFSYWIYNLSYLINHMGNNETPLNEYLRKIQLTSGESIIIGETELDNNFQNKYKESKYNLNFCQNILDEFFKNLGWELCKKGFNRQKSYEAGFAFRMMQINMDLKGTEYMMSLINKLFTPLYQSLFYMPILYIDNRNAFKANHLFSHVLNNFYGGQNSPLFNFSQAIHRYHQFVFYKPESIEIRDEWPFAKTTNEGSATMMFMNAMQINNVKFDKDYSMIVKSSGEVYDSDMINKSININDFINGILNVIEEKYSINGSYEFTEKGIENGDWLDEGRWNHKGDYLQFLAILWYETCLHSLAVKEITD
jgi:hypothetical protein